MDKKGKAEKLIDLLFKEFEYIADQQGELNCRLKINNNGNYRYLSLDSSEFKELACASYYLKHKRTIHDGAVKQATNAYKGLIRSKAVKHRFYVRVGTHGGDFWHDLGDGKATRIAKGKWEVVDNPPIHFKRFAHTAVISDSNLRRSTNCKEDLYRIFNYCYITDQGQRLLYAVKMVASLNPDIPQPVILVVGPPGSSKTSTSRQPKELIDPLATNRTFEQMFKTPSNDKDFSLTANQHWIVPFDNVVKIPLWLSDTICKAVTGDVLSVRKLYSDNDQLTYEVKCCIIMNGTDFPSVRNDFLDRCLYFPLVTVPENLRKEEKQLREKLERDKPVILSSIYTILSKAMEVYPTVKLDEKPRMADFAMWGCAIAKAMGYDQKDFLKAYEDNRELINDVAIDANPFPRIVVSYMESLGNGRYVKKPSELLKELRNHASKEKIPLGTGFPNNPEWLTRRLNEFSHNLEVNGIYFSMGKSEGERVVILEKESPNSNSDSQVNKGLRIRA